jgi:hypothetical protein
MVSYFLIMNVYCARGPGSAKAYHRIVAKRNGFTCILIYISVKVVVAIHARVGLGTLISVDDSEGALFCLLLFAFDIF